MGAFIAENLLGEDVAAALRALDRLRQDVVIDGGFYVLGGDADDQVQTRIDRADALGSSLDDYPDTNALRSRIDEFVSELKGSIGEGPNHSNFPDRSSVRILGIQ